jgi:DNA-binding response OmpR family regulator
MKLLVVEDEVKLGRAIKAGLEQDGYAVDLAHDGEDGYNAARADEYDCIVLDVMMPVMNGFEVAKKTARRRRQNADSDAHRKRSVT